MSLSTGRLPPLNALRAFEAAGRSLSFRAAADELGVTQGAVAQHVRGLEERFGFTLFQRLPRGLALTERGAAYFADVRRAFELLTEATDTVLARPKVVTLSVTPTFASRCLMPRLPRFTADHPEIELRIVATDKVSDMPRDGVDLAVRLAKPPFPLGISAQLLFPQEMIAVAAPGLFPPEDLPLGPERLSQVTILDDGIGEWGRLLQGRAPRTRLRFNQTALVIDAAIAGQGIAMAIPVFLAGPLAAGQLVRITDETYATPKGYYLVTPKQPQAPAATAIVADWLAGENWTA
ncbi:LysR substrate-binding domain-containing protein [Amaricoccus macauensis]|uniref:LysR substrate-binding domain-containing protein n=1 Tax=Amaricoccus macauensis TaxID=57001 RepID=UPI003C7C09FD